MICSAVQAVILRLIHHIPIGLKVLQDVSPTLVAVLVKGGAHHLDLRYYYFIGQKWSISCMQCFFQFVAIERMLLVHV